MLRSTRTDSFLDPRSDLSDNQRCYLITDSVCCVNSAINETTECPDHSIEEAQINPSNYSVCLPVRSRV